MEKIKFKDTQKRVLRAMRDNNEACESFTELLCMVLESYGEHDLSNAMREYHDKGLPSIETIARCARKVREDNPELRAIRTHNERIDREDEYKAYARG